MGEVLVSLGQAEMQVAFLNFRSETAKNQALQTIHGMIGRGHLSSNLGTMYLPDGHPVNLSRNRGDAYLVVLGLPLTESMPEVVAVLTRRLKERHNLELLVLNSPVNPQLAQHYIDITHQRPLDNG